MSRFFRNKGKGKAPATDDFSRVRGYGSSDTASSQNSRELPPPGPPESPKLSEGGFCFSDDDSIGVGSMGGDDFKRSEPKPKEPSEPEPPHPDNLIKEEVFNALAYCGFLDIKQAFLFRWAVVVAWDMQVYRQKKCSKKHRDPILPASPPPVLYRLFAANAILPHTIRTSATTRVLIVLHALYYLSKVSTCAFCVPDQEMLDLRDEDERMFFGVDDGIISKCVIEWAGAMRCAMAWLVDVEGSNYWESHTRDIPDKVGASITRTIQIHLDYKFGISNERLIEMMNAITDDHPLSLTPTSLRTYCPPRGLHGISNWNAMINTS